MPGCQAQEVAVRRLSFLNGTHAEHDTYLYNAFYSDIQGVRRYSMVFYNMYEEECYVTLTEN